MEQIESVDQSLNQQEDFWERGSLGVNGLSGKKYSHMSVKDGVLHNADASGVELEKCCFVDSNLTAMWWEESRLKNVLFLRCSLYMADFSRSWGEGVQFIQCTLGKANFNKSHIKRLVMSECRGDIRLVDANIEGAHISQSNFSEGDFYRARMTGTQFKLSNLSRAKFSFASVANLRLDRTEITDTDFSHVSHPIDFSNVTISPFTPDSAIRTAGRKSAIVITQPIPWRPGNPVRRGGRDTKVVNYGIYKGFDPRAHIYCSDFNELSRGE